MANDSKKLQMDSRDKVVVTPIFSVFQSEPEMRPILEAFLAEIPKHIRALEEMHKKRDQAGFRKLVHQLKGAGGGYGFQAITITATALEQNMDRGDDWANTTAAPLRQFLNVLLSAHQGGKQSSG